MKKLLLIPIAMAIVFTATGCAAPEPAAPEVKGEKPEVIQAQPGMVPPEQRAGAQRTGPSEGDGD